MGINKTLVKQQHRDGMGSEHLRHSPSKEKRFSAPGVPYASSTAIGRLHRRCWLIMIRKTLIRHTRCPKGSGKSLTEHTWSDATRNTITHSVSRCKCSLPQHLSIRSINHIQKSGRVYQALSTLSTTKKTHRAELDKSLVSINGPRQTRSPTSKIQRYCHSLLTPRQHRGEHNYHNNDLVALAVLFSCSIKMPPLFPSSGPGLVPPAKPGSSLFSFFLPVF